jgi:hypothetical protein
METYTLHIKLESDATFGRGDGLAGLVDQEVEHDKYGLPFLRGRTLKGLLVEECANILYALSSQNAGLAEKYQRVADDLFGRPGANLEGNALLRVGDACLPNDLREAIKIAVERKELSRLDVLESLTDVRRQTAMDETGKPEEHSLRATRVILRDTTFLAPLRFRTFPGDESLALLAACVKAFRRAGTARNRGRGRLTARLQDAKGNDVTERHFTHFAEEVQA